MTRALWVGKDEKDGRTNLDRVYRPADKNARLVKKGNLWYIYADGMVDMVPQKVTK